MRLNELREAIGRFEQYVLPEPNSGCWLWTGALSAGKYGSFFFNGRMMKAHRFAYYLHVGFIPERMDLDHLCRTPLCCNPVHLEPVTRSENLRRSPLMDRNSHKTRCPQGHAYEAENLKLTKRGHRLCRECQREATREWRARNAETA